MELRNSLLIFLLVLVCACKNKSFDTVEEMNRYIIDQDNEYYYKKSVEGVDYVIQYRPTDLLVKQELGDKRDTKQIDCLRKKYVKYMYFNLSMSLKGRELLSNVVGDKAKFGKMVNDLAFGMDEKVHLFTQKKDTLIMVDFIYPRMYGMTNNTTIMIVYPRDSKFTKEPYLNFTIEDLGLSTGEVKFKLNTKAILNEPQLRFN